jgi:hypothetical protein
MRLDVPSLVGSKDASNINELIGGFDDHIIHLYLSLGTSEKRWGNITSRKPHEDHMILFSGSSPRSMKCAGNLMSFWINVEPKSSD